MVRQRADAQIWSPACGASCWDLRLAAVVGDSAGRAVRLLSLGQRVFLAGQCVRPEYSHRGIDSADLCAVRHRRNSEGDVHLHRRVAFIMMDTARPIADVSSRYIDTAYTLGASRAADHPEGAGAAGDAAVVQFAAAAVRPGVRLHHAGRMVTEGGGEVGGLGRHHQHCAAPRASRDDHAWC